MSVGLTPGKKEMFIVATIENHETGNNPRHKKRQELVI